MLCWVSSPLQQWLFIDSSDSHTGVAEDEPLLPKMTVGAVTLTALLIYSLTVGSLLGSASSEDWSHLFHLLSFEIAARLISDLSWVCTITHEYTREHPAYLVLTMNERDCGDRELEEA